ncbi:Lrp/AsnC family transcriptional regulator [Spelaeicoccus albus]|uniref:DNA-binding Lrp family transcriptional regulator n=1 Tax=Spelaeicoccus albus TaxID=1280376 RepID=A0A7Z0D3W3_9MICO|nr:Lrp/AsnC family transcriptional regulator [Spelaeicoccus albus]NYI68396.1 DNA-binding Lrp family transcriptional regulator [Spelaeicoccus albus]
MTAKNISLDGVDRALLSALSVNARMSGSALAEKIGVAESTVSVRLRRLISAGVLRGFRADIDVSTFQTALQAMIAVRLRAHDGSHVHSFQQAAPGWPGVITMFHTGGADDYLLHVIVKDSAGLRDFVLQYLIGHPAVLHTETNVIFDRVDGDGLAAVIG